MADINGIELSAHCNATGNAGYIRLGIRMPPIGKPLQPLLATWRTRFPDVELTLHEMNEHDILMATEERRLDVALVTKHTLWPHAIAEPIYREPICLALSKDHPLVPCKTVKWDNLRGETFLVQGWDESQTAREFYATFLGSGARYQSHAASKQSIMALVGAGFGVTLVTESQAEVRFPGVVYKKIDERNAQIEVDLVWVPENKEAVVGRFVAFMRDEARSRHLI
jgi:Transcriptional regulator